MTSPAEARQPVLDNAKFLAVTLVILGHALEPLRASSHGAWIAYLWLYTFHVPVLVLLAGVTSRAQTGKQAWRTLAQTLLAPYLLFQLLYCAFDAWGLGRMFRFDPTTPYWLLWFLLSLLTWRLLLPYALKLPLPWAWAIAAALAAGTIPWIGLRWSAARTLTFFPFFVLGHLQGQRLLEKLGHPRVRLAAAMVLLSAPLVLARSWSTLNVRWLYGSHGYAALGVSTLEGLRLRAGVLLAAAVLGSSFLALVPRTSSVLSTLGQRSLQSYLLHGFILLGLGAYLPPAWLEAPLTVVAALGVGLVLSVLLSTERTRRLTAWLWRVGERPKSRLTA